MMLKEARRGQRKENGNEAVERRRRERWRDGRGSAAARPTLTRDWGEPQVKTPVPIVSVNPTKDLEIPKKAGGGKRQRRDETAQGNGRRGLRNGRGSAAARPTLISWTCGDLRSET